MEQIVTFGELLGSGRTRADVQRSVRAGELVSLGSGTYLLDGRQPLDSRERYRLRVVAAGRRPDLRGVISHDSAAALHRLDLLHPDVQRIHLTCRNVGARTASRVVHRGVVDAVLVDGIRVTTPARTVIDVARSGTATQAFVAVDSALRAGAPREDVLTVAESLGSARGVRRARWAATQATGRAESVGESFSLARMVQRPRFPVPRQQHDVVGADGLFLGRADFAWLDGRIIGEFDGRIKYGARLDPDGTALWDEKRREDRIRAAGAVVARWTWADVEQPERLWRILRRAFGAAGAGFP